MKRVLIKEQKTGKMVFCKYFLNDCGCLEVNFFIPLRGKSENYLVASNGYSFLWDSVHSDCFRLLEHCNIDNGKKVFMAFRIHPRAWMGKSLSEIYSPEIAIQKCLKKINFM